MAVPHCRGARQRGSRLNEWFPRSAVRVDSQGSQDWDHQGRGATLPLRSRRLAAVAGSRCARTREPATSTCVAGTTRSVVLSGQYGPARRTLASVDKVTWPAFPAARHRPRQRVWLSPSQPRYDGETATFHAHRIYAAEWRPVTSTTRSATPAGQHCSASSNASTTRGGTGSATASWTGSATICRLPLGDHPGENHRPAVLGRDPRRSPWRIPSRRPPAGLPTPALLTGTIAALVSFSSPRSSVLSMPSRRSAIST